MVNELIVDFPQQPRRCSLHRSPSFHYCQEIEDRRQRRSTSKSGQSSSARRHSYQPHSSSDPAPTAAARSVRFSEKSSLKLVTKHEERADVSYADLWYTSTDIDLMKFAAVRDVLEARNQIEGGVSTTESNTVCLTGIEGRLTQESAEVVKACRKRCVLAVLREQERQQGIMALSPLFADRHGADMIALASLSQTMKPASRAQKIGMRHQEDVMKSSRRVWLAVDKTRF